MPRRKDRIPVVLDTNVVLGFYLSRERESANSKVYRLWRDRRQLQMVVSDETVTECLEVLGRLGVSASRIARLRERFRRRETVTHVALGARPTESRDPDDNIILAAAVAGKAKFLITNDRDLLDIPAAAKNRFKFNIMTPSAFLAHIARR